MQCFPINMHCLLSHKPCIWPTILNLHPPPKVFSLLFQFWVRCIRRSREHSLQNALREVNFFQFSVPLSPQQFTQCPRQRYFTFMSQLWVRRRQGIPLFCVNCDGDAISIDPAHKMGWVGQRHISPKIILWSKYESGWVNFLIFAFSSSSSNPK